LEITFSFLGIHTWEPDIYIGYSLALHLQCTTKKIYKEEIPEKMFRDRLDRETSSCHSIVRVLEELCFCAVPGAHPRKQLSNNGFCWKETLKNK
jgi:hypothetical protein